MGRSWPPRSTGGKKEGKKKKRGVFVNFGSHLRQRKKEDSTLPGLSYKGGKKEKKRKEKRISDFMDAAEIPSIGKKVQISAFRGHFHRYLRCDKEGEN